jgi:hypothetical protein
MPEDLKLYVQRIYEHAKKQMELLDRALELEEYDTAEFLAHVVVLDLTKLREVLYTQSSFLKSASKSDLNEQ